MYMYVDICMYTYMQIYMCTYVCVYTYVYVYIHVYIEVPGGGGRPPIFQRGTGRMGGLPTPLVPQYIYLCVCTYIYVYIHIYMYIYMYISRYRGGGRLPFFQVGEGQNGGLPPPLVPRQIYLCGCTYIHIYTHIYMHICVYTLRYRGGGAAPSLFRGGMMEWGAAPPFGTSVYICIYTCIYVHSYTHIHIHIYPSQSTSTTFLSESCHS